MPTAPICAIAVTTGRGKLGRGGDDVTGRRQRQGLQVTTLTRLTVTGVEAALTGRQVG